MRITNRLTFLVARLPIKDGQTPRNVRGVMGCESRSNYDCAIGLFLWVLVEEEVVTLTFFLLETPVAISIDYGFGSDCGWLPVVVRALEEASEIDSDAVEADRPHRQEDLLQDDWT